MLSKVTQKAIYPFITIRNWSTTTKLLEILEETRNQRTRQKRMER
jgi:hypothetical protein